MIDEISKLKMISVVIPVYNSEKTIVRTLESVKNQTLLNRILEIIIVNDGSTDRSQKFIQDYANENKSLNIVMINQENRGVSSARNVGMKLAKGDFIALLDSDDEWLPTKTEIQLQVLDNNPHIDFLGGDYNGKSLKILTRKINELYKASVKDLCIKFFPVTPSAIFKREIIEKIGFFNENLRYAEDGNYFLKICRNCEYYHLPEQVVICGDRKPEYGYSGLSSNLKGMYLGNVYNLRELRDIKCITNSFYISMRIFYSVKYIRRILITKFGRYHKLR